LAFFSLFAFGFGTISTSASALSFLLSLFFVSFFSSSALLSFYMFCRAVLSSFAGTSADISSSKDISACPFSETAFSELTEYECSYSPRGSSLLATL
jgi:hypothetical protein